MANLINRRTFLLTGAAGLGAVTLSQALAACTPIQPPMGDEGQMDTLEALDTKQQSIILIAAFTANGDLESLATALKEGLDAGLTVNQINEVLIQMYAYAGFPRSLNGINTFMAVVNERKEAGVEDECGPEANPLPDDTDKDAYGAQVRMKLAGQETIPPPSGYQVFAPAIDTFLKEHLFADIFARDILDHKSRELATIAALASMSGTAGQLFFHVGAAMNMGVTEAELHDFITVLDARVGKDEAESAAQVVEGVLSRRG